MHKKISTAQVKRIYSYLRGIGKGICVALCVRILAVLAKDGEYEMIGIIIGLAAIAIAIGVVAWLWYRAMEASD